jgi:signal transduction histidine kinase
MPRKQGQIPFEASANLQRLIGRELVPNDEVAITELVKNTYDSGAGHVVITIQPTTEKEPGYIEVRDDGEGMTLAELERLFLVAGYSERPDQVGSTARIPTGEKGIGRFAADKLGKHLTVYTRRTKQKSGIQLDINWEDFRNKRKRFRDVTAKYKDDTVDRFPESDSGTILRITGLRAQWPRQKLESLRISLAELIDPFHRPKDFKIILQVPASTILSGPIEQRPPTGPDIDIKLTILSDGKVKRTVRTSLDEGLVPTETLPSSVDANRLTGLEARFCYYFRRPSKHLTANLRPAVRLYRDGFRVEPFSSPTADWLGISEKRAKRAGHAHIVPSRLFGFVEIFRQKHPGLQDTTSRQAMIDGDTARSLVTFLIKQLSYVEEIIRKRFTEPRWKESKKRQAVEFEQARLQTLGIMSFGLAHELRQPLQYIRSEADNIVKRLQDLDVKDKDIEDSQRNIDTGIERIDKNINLVANISRGNFDDIETFDLAEIVNNDCQVFQTRCAALGIKLTMQTPAEQKAVFNRTTLSTVLLNLLKNSLDAVTETKDKRPPEIRVRLSRVKKLHRLEVSDTGDGIPAEVKSRIFKKFASKKTGGMGVGLYYCKLILAAHGGDISFESVEGNGSTFTVTFQDREI